MTPILRPLIAAALGLLVGCSSFDALYDKAAARPAPAGSVEGAWDGTWQSQAGHGGDRLRAVVTKTGPDAYHIWFRAKFWAIFEASQEVDVTATPATPLTPIIAAGQQDLGYLYGGVYRYKATLTPAQLDATYTSTYDHGDFHLTRPAPK